MPVRFLKLFCSGALNGIKTVKIVFPLILLILNFLTKQLWSGYMVTCCTSWLHGLDPKKFWGNGLFIIAQNVGEDNMKGWYYEVGMHYCLSILSNQILTNDKRGGRRRRLFWIWGNGITTRSLQLLTAPCLPKLLFFRSWNKHMPFSSETSPDNPLLSNSCIQRRLF